MTIARSQMYRQLYQMGGQGMAQQEPIFPRLETLSQNLGQAEQTLGAPSNQFDASSITTAITGRPQGFANGGFPRSGIGSLTNRQGYFFGGIGDVFGGIGDILGGAGDVLGNVVGKVGDVVGDVVSSDVFQKALPLAVAYFTGNPAAATASEGSSFLPSFLQAGANEGGIGSFSNILGNIGNFMPQGETSGFNPYQFASNLIQNYDDNNEGPPTSDTGGGIVDVLGTILSKIGGRLPETVDAISKLLSQNKELAAVTGAGTLAKLTFDEIKALNDYLKGKYAAYETGKGEKRTQYRTAEGRQTLPGYNVAGVPRTIADVYRKPAMRGGIMNSLPRGVPMGEQRRNPAGVMELDYRKKGGFVPPIGVKEKADDIPAMLSNNEFVFDADSVRKAGGGSVKKGAERMYALMRQLKGSM